MPDLLKLFVDANARSIDNGAIQIPQAIARKGDALTVIALAFVGKEAGRLSYLTVIRELVKGADELIFGLDRFCLPGQGVETEDALSVAHWTSNGWAFGVMPYRATTREVLPIDWANAHWRQELQSEMTSQLNGMSMRFGPLPPAMLLPLRVRNGGADAT